MSHDPFVSRAVSSSDPADDPRLTAYALGEPLEPADRTWLEQRLALDPAARAFVAEVRATAEELKLAFILETAADRAEAGGSTTPPLPAPAPAGHPDDAPLSVGPAPEPSTRRPTKPARVLRFPQLATRFAYAVTGLAAAAFVMLLIADYRAFHSASGVKMKISATEASHAITPPPAEQMMELALPAAASGDEGGAQAYVVMRPLAPGRAEDLAALATEIPSLAAPELAPPGPDLLASSSSSASAIGAVGSELLTPALATWKAPESAIPTSAPLETAPAVAPTQTTVLLGDLAATAPAPVASSTVPLTPAPGTPSAPPATVARTPSGGTGLASIGDPSALPPPAPLARADLLMPGREEDSLVLEAFTVSADKDRTFGTATAANTGLGHRGPMVGRTNGARTRSSADLAAGDYADGRARLVNGVGANRPSPTRLLEFRAESPVSTLVPVPAAPPSTEAYAHVPEASFERVADHPLSTFSIDVDTASYANVRRFLTGGQRPPPAAVRLEELINYFPYAYPPPAATAVPPPAATAADTSGVAPAPFAAHLEVASAPWAPEHRLVRIALKGREVATAARPPAQLVFLIDVSGSMDQPNKLPLVRESLRLLVNQLRPDDRLAIVVYAGASGLALPSTPLSHRAEILAAIEALTPGGSTNGAMGIQLAYDIAKANFLPGGLNRVILCTDGDFNVGVTSEGELVRLIADKARSGVFLTVLGFGMGNLKDSTLEQLADRGNGSYGYIDTRREAEKLLVAQVQGTLHTIAKDVKLQVEFNPATVAAYRLIGYDNRRLRPEDFNNDRIDAGEIGAGHTITAFYEVVPVGAPDAATITGAPGLDALKYQTPAPGAAASASEKLRTSDFGLRTSPELLTVKIRYKAPAADVSARLEFPLADEGHDFAAASEDFRFAASVAAFGLLLRDSAHARTISYADVSDWATAARGDDREGYRAEFLSLVERARALPH